jgi:hypothetical protein
LAQGETSTADFRSFGRATPIHPKAGNLVVGCSTRGLN